MSMLSTFGVPPRASSSAWTSTGLARWRARLAIALGLVWLLDAGLQYQSYMFTMAFPEQVIRPTADDNPAWVREPVTWSAHLMEHHIVVWNGLFASIQLALALGILWRPTRKLALATSVVWALMVWWLGEGLGGILVGPVLPASGAPGAAVLYAVIAILIWPRDTEAASAVRWATGSVAFASPLRVVGAVVVWLALWGSFVWETLLPDDRSPTALSSMVSGMAPGEPGWLKSIDSSGGSAIGRRGTEFSIVIAVVCTLIALSVFEQRLLRPAIAVAIVLAVLFWVWGENFGEIATGEATDPNSGPLLVILALCYWPLDRVPRAEPVASGSTDDDRR